LVLDKFVPPTDVVPNVPAVIMPVCVIAPLELSVKPFVTVEAAIANAMLSVNVALEPVSATAPVKLLALPFVVKSIELAPALKLDVPVIVNAPV
jgi:hypothetical protein